jgi:hypothetical protein
MKKYHVIVIVWFFVVTSAIVLMKLLIAAPVDPALVSKRLAVELAREDLRLRHLQRNDDALFYGSLSLMGVLGLSALIVASGVHRERVKRASVHTYRIGGNEIVILERDLPVAWQIVTGLTNAEELKALAPQRAIELYTLMADVQSRQIQALLGKRGLQPAFPPETPALPVTPGQLPSAAVPSFQELLRSGEISQGKPMILGFVNGQPRRGSFLDIYSAAVAGESGSGKTGTLLFLIGCGLVACHVRFVCLDPHYPHPKSLGAKTKPLWEAGVIRMATNKDEMVAAMQAVVATIDARLSQQDTETTPVVLVIDELLFLGKTSIAGDVQATMERISTEGRKCAVYLLASSQTWLASRTGKDSTVRDTLTSAYVHRIKPKQANLLLQDKDEVKKVASLKKAGDVLFCPVNDDSVICQIPYTNEEDMHRVADLVGRPRIPTGKHHETLTETGGNTPPKQAETPVATFGEMVRNRLAEIKLSDKTASQNKLAEAVGLSKKEMSELLHGKMAVSDTLKHTMLAVLDAWQKRGNTPSKQGETGTETPTLFLPEVRI